MPDFRRTLALPAINVVAWAMVTLAAIGSAPHAQASEPAPLDPMLHDAQLADVQFIDAARGWAVGDRGVIWHTADGGRTWAMQASGVECRLASVCFLDDQIGWAAGGYTQPYTHASVGVVLHTRDGGQTWRVERDRILPIIRRIGFFDSKQGWAIGQSSSLFPTGVFTTNDGGRSWAAVPGTAARAWLAGDFLNPDLGAVAGRDSQLAGVSRSGVELQPADFGLRAIARLKLSAKDAGWLVGDGGLIMTTRDAGRSWQTPDGPLPAGATTHFDFGALAVRGSHVWAAGTPGTRVLHSPDGGRTWQAADTGQQVPIRALSFVDEQHGWAVGDLGTILATADGGRTWRTQQAGGTRAAFAGFLSRPVQLPHELLARLAADEGYLGVMEVLNREDAEIRSALDSDARTHEAAVLGGASAGLAAWRFPLRSASLKLTTRQLIEDWNRANDGQALERLEAHVVGRLRMWRPNVVVTVAADARDPLSMAINQIVLTAAEKAGDPKYFADQISQAGLAPWKVQKVYAALDGAVGTTNINTAQVTSRLGRSIGELAAPSRGLVDGQYQPPQANVGFRLLVDQIPQGVGERDFFSGIPISPGREARRAYAETARNNLAAAQREAQMYRNLQAILAQADATQADGHFLANIGEQTRRLEPDRAAEVLFQLGKRYWMKGRLDMAAECYEVIAERHANHPLAGAALVWLVQYYASSETAHRTQAAGQILAQRTTSSPILPTRFAPGAGQLPEAGSAELVRQAGGVAAASGVVSTGSIAHNPERQQRWAKAAGYAAQLEKVEPAFAFEPRVRFPLAVAQRRQGLSGAAERFLHALRYQRPHDAWWLCGQGEAWLAERGARMPKPVLNCTPAPIKPRLDGRLDEPIWRSSNAVELHSPLRDDGQWSAVAMLAYDNEYLYLGISCSRAPGFRYESTDKPRSRDADLTPHDRVELLLDLDRDYATYYRLVVDHRGWTAESCWHDTTWNPSWFVASGGDEQAWTAEVAIPWTELTETPPEQTTAWAVGIQRIVPGIGFQSWTTPASPEITPEGFGLLTFE